MKIYTIYKLETPPGKIYIGQTCNISDRFNNYKNPKSKTPINNSIKKWGWENIKKELLFKNLSKEEADNKEIELIFFYKNLGISLNIAEGGKGGVRKCLYKIDLKTGITEQFKSIQECCNALRKDRNFVNRYLTKVITKKAVLKNGYIISFNRNCHINVFKDNNPKLRKDKKAFCKLKDKDIIEIRKLISQKVSQRKIGELFKVSQTTIYAIKKGRIWKHL